MTNSPEPAESAQEQNPAPLLHPPHPWVVRFLDDGFLTVTCGATFCLECGVWANRNLAGVDLDA